MVSDLLLSSYDRFVPGISVCSSCLILAHHILRLCTPKLNAVLDWFVTLLEICMVAYLTGFSTFMWKSISPTFSIILVARPIQLTALIISEIWATATIMKSQEKIILQHFEFLGGCIASDGPYSLSQILFNRSTRKPRSTGQGRVTWDWDSSWNCSQHPVHFTANSCGVHYRFFPAECKDIRAGSASFPRLPG
ncbi:hypothetical protein B0H11DRAFT_2076605 [Mycena galericulata]|nr:hypothetical protein B0H11DRAFT_2076605 [Mycena galericulata]